MEQLGKQPDLVERRICTALQQGVQLKIRTSKNAAQIRVRQVVLFGEKIYVIAEYTRTLQTQSAFSVRYSICKRLTYYHIFMEKSNAFPLHIIIVLERIVVNRYICGLFG